MSFPLRTAKGYIFDFNGTLILDEKENREAWRETVRKMRGKPQSDEEFQALNGRTDRETVLYYFPEADDETIEHWIEEKEALYKTLCIEHKLSFAQGAEALLSFLSERNIPIAIASSAPKINMDWYIPYFGLLRFFGRENIIAGRDDIPSKPDGTIFRVAAESIDLNAGDTIIFEDSLSGVRAAIDAGCGCIYRLGREGKENFSSFPSVTLIDSFSDLVYSDLSFQDCTVHLS